MKFYKIIFLLIYIICLSSSAVFSNDQIAFLNVDTLMSQTISGKKIINNLNQLNKKNVSILKLKEDKIKNLENDINIKKNIISKDETKSKISNLQKEISIFRNEKEKLVKEFNLKKNNELNIFFKNVTPLIEQYIKKNDISIILDKKNIFMANQEKNITQDIIDLINNKIK